MSLQSKINFIHKLDDPEKLGATLKIIMESENEDIIERANELWMLLVLVHGDLLTQKFNEIDATRKVDDNYQEEMRKLVHDATVEAKVAHAKNKIFGI